MLPCSLIYDTHLKPRIYIPIEPSAKWLSGMSHARLPQSCCIARNAPRSSAVLLQMLHLSQVKATLQQSPL